MDGYYRYLELRAGNRNPKRAPIRMKSGKPDRKVMRSIRPYKIKMRVGGKFNQVRWAWNCKANPIRSRWFHHYLEVIHKEMFS